MKKISLFLCAVVAVFVIACSGGNTSYNPNTCKELVEKINNHEQLTEKDYDVMIDQLVAASKELKKKQDEVGNDPQKVAELIKEPEIAEMAQYAMGMAFYIGMHENELSPSNIEKMKKAKQEIDAMK